MVKRALLTFILICGMFIIICKAKVLGIAEKDFVTDIIKEVPNTKENEIVAAFDQGRRHLHRRKKILKHIYPILMAALLAKLIVVPLILKLLIAATSSAFVMSKIALVTSAILGVSWLLAATGDRPKLQIVEYPASGSKKFYSGWNVRDKFTTPYYAPSYSDWSYEGSGGDNNEKIFFL